MKSWLSMGLSHRGEALYFLGGIGGVVLQTMERRYSATPKQAESVSAANLLDEVIYRHIKTGDGLWLPEIAALFRRHTK